MAQLIIRTLERIVSVPGTLDDLKKWRTLLSRISTAPSWALLFENVRGLTCPQEWYHILC